MTVIDPPPPYSTPRGDLSNFIGDDPLPPPPLASSDTAARLGSSPPDPSVWSNEQQQQFLQTLLGGGPPPSEPHSFNVNAPVSSSAVPDDPLLALMSSLGVDPGIGRGVGAVPQSKAEAKPKTIQKLLPILHVVAVWALVAFFIFWREPEAFRERNPAIISAGDIWNRWARLASGPAERSSWGIEIVVSLPLVVCCPTVVV
jgi:hypothetical protein